MPRKKKEVIPPKAPDTPSPTPSAPRRRGGAVVMTETEMPTEGPKGKAPASDIQSDACDYCDNGWHQACSGFMTDEKLQYCGCKVPKDHKAASDLNTIVFKIDSIWTEAQRQMMNRPSRMKFSSEFSEEATIEAMHELLGLGTILDDGVRNPNDIFWWGGEKKTVKELNDLRQMGKMSYADYRKALRLPEKITIPEKRRAMLFVENLDEDHIVNQNEVVFVLDDYLAHVCVPCSTGKHLECKTYIQWGTGIQLMRRDCDCWAQSHEFIVAVDEANGVWKVNEKFLKGNGVTDFDGKGNTVNKRAHILQTAEKLINGDRADTYGPPEVSFGRIADLLNAMGWRKQIGEGTIDKSKVDVERLDAVDVALGLVQLKVSRVISSPDHEDSWVDIAGYAGLGGEIAIKRANRDLTHE